MAQYEQWEGFKGRLWKDDVDVRDFIQNNYVPYEGDASFLADATEATDRLWADCRNFRKKSVQKAEYWIWRQRSCPGLRLMALDILRKI